MDSTSSDPDTSVFNFPDSAVEVRSARKFETSISVSSLAEKFENSGDFSKSEEKTRKDCRFGSESEMERTHPLPEDICASSESNGVALQHTSKAKGELLSCNKEENCSLSQATVVENSNAENSVSGTTLSKEQSESVTGGVSEASSEQKQNTEGISSKVSLKDLEQSFIDALNMVNGDNETKKSADALSLPSIQITTASDREDSSDDAEETKPKRLVETDVRDTTTRKTIEDEGRSISTASQGAIKDPYGVSAEERKAVMYISSDLPIASQLESLEMSENRTVSADCTRMQDSNEIIDSSCLRSKSLHGIIFLVSIAIFLSGCILYGFARVRKIPDSFEYFGLIVSVMAGMVGAFSCYCYTCLEIFPGSSRGGYERIPDAGLGISTLILPAENETAYAQNLDDSLSSENERATRRQNGTLSTGTSVASLKSELGEYLVVKKSEHQQLVDKTEKLKNGMLELLDSFNDFMSKMEPIDKLVEIESGTMDGF